MAKKNKNNKRVYEVSRKELVKDFDSKFAKLYELHDQLEVLLHDAEDIVELLESGGNRKKLANEFEDVFEKLRVVWDEGGEANEDIGICIDRMTDVKG